MISNDSSTGTHSLFICNVILRFFSESNIDFIENKVKINNFFTEKVLKKSVDLFSELFFGVISEKFAE